MYAEANLYPDPRSAAAARRPHPCVYPHPAPLALDERKHRAEALVYDSFLGAETPMRNALAFYSVTLPFEKLRRREVDFLVLAPEGIAIVEVKGGLVAVDSVAGQSAYWRQFRLDGTPVDKPVSGAQIFTTTQVLQGALRDEAGIVVHDFAQIYVFPDTPRSGVPAHVLERNDSAQRDFPRLVFKDELDRFGMWAIVADEFTLPGRSTPLTGEVRRQIAKWAASNINAQPRSAAPASDPAASAADETLRHKLANWPLAENEMGPAKAPRHRKMPGPMFWLGLAGALAIGWFLWHRPASAPPAPAPAVRAAPVAAAPAVPPAAEIPPHLNLSPVPRPAPTKAQAAAPVRTDAALQAALTRGAAMPPDTKIALESGSLRFLGPVAGRPGCHMVDLAVSSGAGMRIACVGTDGSWSY